MNPAHETRMGIAGRVRQNVVQETLVDVGKIGTRMRNGFPEMPPHFSRNRLPYGTFFDVFNVIERIVEHPMRLLPKCRPIGRIQRFRAVAAAYDVALPRGVKLRAAEFMQ